MKIKTKKSFLYSFIILIILLLIIPYALIKYNLHVLENRVVNYLVEEKGYQQNELQSVNGAFGKLPLLSVWVIFEDEPHIQYQYVERESIRQLAYTVSEQGKIANLNHHDIDTNKLLHYDSYDF
ncbi:DUF3139 domain-containing protein [Bacillus horti]|uniref:DUF3139 domain-containing protein n=1 Tax=Caldalkalibacillus horti TaxID=77523 RepID=A0ABT9W2K8_9BACI|nr:DUF3139 domain-containing protein [Bacillus horti]MDQ0167485.1 hypothetical protein [Bacillus horti]